MFHPDKLDSMKLMRRIGEDLAKLHDGNLIHGAWISCVSTNFLLSDLWMLQHLPCLPSFPHITTATPECKSSDLWPKSVEPTLFLKQVTFPKLPKLVLLTSLVSEICLHSIEESVRFSKKIEQQ